MLKVYYEMKNLITSFSSMEAEIKKTHIQTKKIKDAENAVNSFEWQEKIKEKLDPQLTFFETRT